MKQGLRWLLYLWAGCMIIVSLAAGIGRLLRPDGLSLWIHNRTTATRWTVDVRTGTVQAGMQLPRNSLKIPGKNEWLHIRSSLGESTITRYYATTDPQPVGSYDVIPALNGLFFSPDGTLLYLVDATGSRQTRLHELHLQSGEMTQLSEHEFRTDSILPAPDARHVLLKNELLGAADSETLLVDLVSGDAQSLPPLPGAAAWSPDGRWLAYVTADGLTIADMQAETLAARLASAQLQPLEISSNDRALNWSEDNQLAVSANGVRVLSPPDFDAQQVYRRGGLLRSWSPDGCCLLLDTRSGAGVFGPHILHIADGTIHLAETARMGAFSRAVWSPDAAYVAFYQSDPIQGHEILVYAADSGERQWRYYLRPDAFPPFVLDAPFAFQWRTP